MASCGKAERAFHDALTLLHTIGISSPLRRRCTPPIQSVLSGQIRDAANVFGYAPVPMVVLMPIVEPFTEVRVQTIDVWMVSSKIKGLPLFFGTQNN